MARDSKLLDVLKRIPSGQALDTLGSPADRSAAPPDEMGNTPSLLKGLTSGLSATKSRGGALGQIASSVEAMRQNAVLEIPPDLVDEISISDRLWIDQTLDPEFIASIREHGQQVPILLRPHPTAEGRYEIVYGRRRLRAAKLLGKLVRATVRPMDDDQLVIAQGQENSARRNLSFIEKAAFARRLEELGKTRLVICAALVVDETTLSRMMTVVSSIPMDIIELIGPAESVGRRQWASLADASEDDEAVWSKVRQHLAGLNHASSDQRFAAALAAIAAPRGDSADERVVRGTDGRKIGEITVSRSATKIALPAKTTGQFAAFLVDRLPHLFEEYERSKANSD